MFTFLPVDLKFGDGGLTEGVDTVYLERSIAAEGVEGIVRRASSDKTRFASFSFLSRLLASN